MPRPPRIILKGIPLHHIQRGNDRRPVFMDDRDHLLYRDLLREGCGRFGCAVHAYVMMTNHVHLLLTPAEPDSVARLTQWMGRHYVRRFNRRHERTGTLWEGRFRASLIDSARHLLACTRYIDLNPVRAGMVARPERYPWSSHARLAYGTDDDLVTEHQEYQRLGRTASARQLAYRALCDESLPPAELTVIRRSAQRGDPLGDDVFRAMVVARAGTRRLRQPHGGDRRSAVYRCADSSMPVQQLRPLDRGRVSTTLTP